MGSGKRREVEEVAGQLGNSCYTASRNREVRVTDTLIQIAKHSLRLKSTGTAALLIGLLAGHALAQKVTVEFDQSIDFSKFKTYSILKGELNSGNPALNSDLVKKQIEADIDRSLTAKGLTKVENNQADLHVVYTLGASRGSEVETYPAGWRGWGTRVVRVPYNEGTLVINLRDHSTHSLVWRGIARQDESDATKIQSKLDDMVKKALEKYPPKPKK
jgi:hypothetical protein